MQSVSLAPRIFAVVFMAALGSTTSAQTVQMTGICERLIVGRQDFTDGCRPILLSSVQEPNSVLFHFPITTGAVVTLIGSDLINPTTDTDMISLVTFELDLGIPDIAPAIGEARGTCDFSNPFLGPMLVACIGEVQIEGLWSPLDASFRTDGSAPFSVDLGQ